VAGLDPLQTAIAEFTSDDVMRARHKLIYNLNNLEPPFPWAVVAFSPGLFNLNDIPDPIDFSGRPVHLG